MDAACYYLCDFHRDYVCRYGVECKADDSADEEGKEQ